MGSEDDKKAGIERRDKDKQQRSSTVKQGVIRQTRLLSNAEGREAIAASHSVA